MVSIVIPTYNRSSIIGATLDSIIEQSYRDWECIVVDDSSTDYTSELLKFYNEKDGRIKYVSRPGHRPKGANACRNYGFEISTGEYIQWFDSDDLMVPEFLEKKVLAIQEQGVDYVISKALNFQDPDPENVISKNEEYYLFQNVPVTNYNYVTQKINWLTYDFLAKREIVLNIRFNEKLKSSQERNFFSKVTAYSLNYYFLNEYLTLRRIHPQSVQRRLRKDKERQKAEYFEFLFYTWKDLKKKGDPRAVNYLFNKMVFLTMNSVEFINYVPNLALGFIRNKKPYAGLWYFLYQTSSKFLGRGVYLRNRFKKYFSL